MEASVAAEDDDEDGPDSAWEGEWPGSMLASHSLNTRMTPSLKLTCRVKSPGREPWTTTFATVHS